MTPRIGFCCKWIDRPDQVDGIRPLDEARQYNTGATTVAWLNRQSRKAAEQKLWDLMVRNIESARKLVEKVGTLDEHLRMVRLSSDILPVYTEPNWSYFWRRPDVVSYCEKEFSVVGNLARDLGVRLSFHPGQFCCIVSDNDDIVARSIEELEYHTDMMRWMDFGKSKLDFKINIHLSGRLGSLGFEQAWHKMSPELRNALTLENDEYQQGLDDLLPLGQHVGLVLDIHHHLIKTGEYIQANDPRIQQVQDSWQGVRPVIHYSQSSENYLLNHEVEKTIDITELLLKGYKKSKLRAHSDFMWNRAVNQWARQHWDWTDVQVEAKGKNLSSRDLFNQWQKSI